MKFDKYTLVILSVTAGLLTGIAWSGWCTGLVLLVSFAPFLIIENHLYENRARYSQNAFFLYVLPGMIIFSIRSIGWTSVYSITAAVLIIIGLSFLMASTIWLGHLIRLRAGNLAGIISILTLWLSYEYVSLNNSILTPWLNLGNGLAQDVSFIQWYEYTGTAGGTLWILMSNLLLAQFIIRLIKGMRRNTLLIAWISLIIVPSAFSLWRYNSIRENTIQPSEVVLVQPNIDPYTEKFTIPFKDQLNKVIKLAGDSVTEKTAWILTPETTVDDSVYLYDIQNDQYIKMIKELTAKHPGTSVVTGMVTYSRHNTTSDPPPESGAKRDPATINPISYNSALRIDTGNIFEVYHKSKLVPGVEIQFLSGAGKLLNRILPYFGGTKWGYGTQDTRVNFTHPRTGEKVAPVICYESVFGSFVTEYVRNGANALFIITNDGWWYNTNGYTQHLSYASLRAIETRRPVARCGNTGISCFIDIRGNRRIETEWWTETVLKGSIIPEDRITFYVKYGDYIMRISLFISILLTLYTFIIIPLMKKQKNFVAGMQPSD